ncbi:MAG: hypothetical protein LQ340_001580, partial [Diploschistes diacapsis]
HPDPAIPLHRRHHVPRPNRLLWPLGKRVVEAVPERRVPHRRTIAALVVRLVVPPVRPADGLQPGSRGRDL